LEKVIFNSFFKALITNWQRPKVIVEQNFSRDLSSNYYFAVYILPYSGNGVEASLFPEDLQMYVLYIYSYSITVMSSQPIWIDKWVFWFLIRRQLYQYPSSRHYRLRCSSTMIQIWL
jgi:hypothetical protein